MAIRVRSALVALAVMLPAFGAAAASSEITLPGDHVFPESITSGRDGTVYIGSVGQGMIYRAAPGAATAASFIPPSKDLMSVMGVLADDKDGLLFACTNDWSARGTQTQGDKGPAALKIFDLKSGKLQGSYEFPGGTGMCNDIAIGKDGAAYVSDTMNPRILRLPRKAAALETWLENPAFKDAGLDGIAFGGDGNLYVNGFSSGKLFRVAVDKGMKAGAVTELAPSQPLNHPDGMRTFATRHGAEFLMIEGGHLDRVTIDGDKATVDILKADLPGSVAVTQVGGTAWVATGQLNYLFDPKLKGQTPAPFKAAAVPLPLPPAK